MIGNRLRVSGKVAPQTLHVAEDRKQVAFSLEGTKKNLHVICSGQPPDNLAEQMDVVVEGRLDASGLLHADKILTRCASKYKSQQKLSAMPPTASQPMPRGEP